jgi:cyclomaltodextrinase / maltogenic alpha-amylase / neopullulanase
VWTSVDQGVVVRRAPVVVETPVSVANHPVADAIVARRVSERVVRRPDGACADPPSCLIDEGNALRTSRSAHLFPQSSRGGSANQASRHARVNLPSSFTAPCAWARDAVMYQIFVDRFAKGRRSQTGRGDATWGSRPTRHGFMGGTLQGIIDRLEYLQDLGVNLLYLTPIFWSSSNHRYNVYDYYRIDPRLGTLEVLQLLLTKAHGCNIRVILDGVFNHCGRGFFPFYDVMENKSHSAFKAWFHIRRFPVHAYETGTYRGWQDRPVMPIFNLGKPAVREYLLEVARYWTGQGIDGWRLDAVGEVQGHVFWKAFRRAIRRINPEAYLLAEHWGDGQPWLKNDQFDGGTNYAWRKIALDFFIHRTIRANTFVSRLSVLLKQYPWDQTMAMANLLGSHDTKRLYSIANGELERIKLALVFQFVYPGIPSVYYGDEVGLQGQNDPDNRRAMEWRVTKWNHELRSFIQRLIAIRMSLNPLRQGDWQSIATDALSNVCVFSRAAKADRALIVLHNHPRPWSGSIPIVGWNKPPRRFKDHISLKEYDVRDGKLLVADLPPMTGLILTPA